MFTPMLLATTVLVIYYALDISLLKGLKRGSRAADTPSRVGRVTQRDSNSNPISPVPTGPEEEAEEEEEEEVVETEEEEAATSLDHCQSESYHWCEEDDLTSSEAATSTDKTIGSSGDPDPHSAEEYAEMAKKVDLNLAHIDMENFKSADLFQSEQIRSLLIEYNRPILCSQSQLSQDDCSLTDCGSLCKSGPLFSPQRAVPGVCGVGGGKGISPSDCSIDSLNMAERDECWLLEEAGDGASQLLCRTNMTNYTLAWSSSASGTDQDLDYNEPGTSSSGSEQSHWSSSGSGGRVAPPIPPWPITSRQQQFTGLRNDPTPRKLQCWAPQPHQSSNKQPTPTKPNVKKSTTEQKSHKEDAQQQEIRTTELTNFQSIGKSEDSPSLSDMDNGNGKAATPKDNRTRQRPVFTKTESKATTPPTSSAGLSLLQIYMRQRSQTSMERESNKKSDDVIASGGGEGWVEDYPSSADEKLGLESICSSLADEDEDDDSEEDDDEEDSEEDDEDDLCQNNRSLTLTDVSDIEQTSIQIDAVPFNTTAATSSLDKLIAKIKPFELGLSPASIEEHWNFESRMRLAAPIPAEASTLVDKGCQVAINPATSATQEESTLTDPIKPQAYLIFPSYSLPDLSFLKKHDYTWIGDVLLSPQNLPASSRKPEPVARQHTQQSFDDLKRRQMGHVKDWESLKILLPEEIRQQINNIKPSPVNRNSRPRPKSCEQTVILRNAKKTSPRPTTCRGSVAWPDATAGYMLPTVPQSPPGGADGGPPPLPKRTASLPHSPAAVQRQRRNVALSTESVKSAVSKRAAANTSPTGPASKPAFGYTMRKTVSFGEHLSGGFLKMSNQRRPLSLSHWSGGGSLDMNSPGEEDVAVNLEQKQELVKAVSIACAQLCKIMNQPINISDEDSCTNHSKSVARCLTSQLSPAIYQLLSDGLLPNVNTFFGQVNNSVWRVVEASVKKGPGLPWIEELVFCLNSEESLPEGPVRFGVFITELVNMGGLDWWLDNLSAKETILRRHYAPHGFLYLCHTSTRPLMDELQSYLRPLAALPFDNTLPLPPPKKLVVPSPGNKQTSVTSPAASKPSTPTKTILKSPTRSKTQRPMSYVQNSPSKMSPKPLYRRTQSQHSGLSPKKSNNVAQQQQQQQPAESSKTETKVEEFSSLKQKWESLCGDRKKAGETATGGGNKSNIAPVIPAPVTAPATGETSPLKSRIPRPVFRFSK